MIQIVVKILPNGDKRRAFEVAVAEAGNISDLADVSDYAVNVCESQNPLAQPGGALDWSSCGHIFGHDRRQSVWALVAKVAAFAVAEAEKVQR